MTDPRDADPAEVRAAGGLVVRESDDGAEFAVVHRPRYDDWTFPKGKCDPGETFEAAARREVAEETGLHCDLGPEIGSTHYVDNRGRTKVVRYWLMPAPPDAGPAVARAVPNREVDELRWLRAADAAILLSYAHDRELLGGLAGAGWESGAPGGPDPEGSPR